MNAHVHMYAVYYRYTIAPCGGTNSSKPDPCRERGRERVRERERERKKETDRQTNR